MSRKKKILIGAGVLIVLVVMGSLALRGRSGTTVKVRVERVERRDLVARVTATGHIEPKTSVDISADVSGRIVDLTVEEGDDVREGQLLLVIDPARFEAALQRAEAALSEARSREAQARGNSLQADRDWDRIRQLKEAASDMVTATEYEQARTRAEVQAALWESAKHAVDMARAGVREARDQLAKTVIRAPMTGRVTRLSVERGETAVVGTMNNPGSLLLTIADLSVMEAVIEVDETDVPEITVGDSTLVSVDAFRDREFLGRVTKIGNSSIRPRTALQPTSADQAIDFEVRVTLEDPDPALRTDLSATADIVTAVRPAVLAIPIIALTLVDPGEFERIPGESEAVRTAEDDRPAPNQTAAADDDAVEGVFVVEGSLVRFRPVEVGIAGDNYFEVLEGLDEGETIVSGSYQAIRELKDGSEIEIEERDEDDGGAGGP